MWCGRGRRDRESGKIGRESKERPGREGGGEEEKRRWRRRNESGEKGVRARLERIGGKHDEIK